MESERLGRENFGGSLKVENVQGLISRGLKKNIPPRYIRDDLEFAEISIDESLHIPVIDMSKLDDIDESTKLHLACKDWGFFQLINHGISEVVENMKTVSEDFFKLSQEDKMSYAKLPNDLEGYGRGNILSEEQKLDWGDVLAIITRPLPIRNMAFWPISPISFSVTLLVQVNDVQGLQIKKYDKWIPVKPLPDAIIVNIGDIIEIMSNGEYKSIEHRATVNYDKVRMSIAAFHNPNMKAMVGPIPDLLKKNNAVAKYKNIVNEDYVKLFATNKLDGKRLLDQMKSI